MTKKEKVCLEDSQINRLAGDAYRMGKGQTEGICDAVREIVEEAVPIEERIGKAKKKQRREKSDNPIRIFKTAHDFVKKLREEPFF